MKSLLTTTALLMCLLTAVACDKAPNLASGNGGITSQGSNNNLPKSYRFKAEDGQCDTYKRSFKTQKELCYAIQVPELNNDDCAKDQRIAYFAQNCSNLTTLDETKAAEQIKNVNGKYVDCTYSEKNLPDIRQYSASRDMSMEHTATRALIRHFIEESTGKITLSLQLFDLATNRLISRVQQTWTNEIEPLSLSPSGAIGSPVLTCVVSLAADPNRK